MTSNKATGAFSKASRVNQGLPGLKGLPGLQGLQGLQPGVSDFRLNQLYTRLRQASRASIQG